VATIKALPDGSQPEAYEICITRLEPSDWVDILEKNSYEVLPFPKFETLEKFSKTAKSNTLKLPQH
jgi:hypothetical protein